MASLFTKKQLDKALCSDEEMTQAKKYGAKFEHQEFGQKLTAYLYQGAVFVVDITDAEQLIEYGN